LKALYNSPRLNNKDDPLDELFFILLSQMTTGPSYERVFDRLREAVSTWDDLANMSVFDLRAVIADAGLVNQKAPRFIEIARRLKRDFGTVTLAPLAAYSDDEAEGYLMSLPGVGRKTAKCVMMYAMGRAVLPVDTHVARVARRLGLIDERTPVGRLHSALEGVIAPELRYDFHVNAIAHGRVVCRAHFPKCSACQISSLCPTGRGARASPKQGIQLTAAS